MLNCVADTTVKIVGLKEIAEEGENVPRAKFILKETILNDVQFRGAISDFYEFKPQIANADYDPILCRYNADDQYDDGNNFEVCPGLKAFIIVEPFNTDPALLAELGNGIIL